MITLSHVQKQFGSKLLFKDCFLQIGVRDRVGLIGPNGSGKTTLFRMLMGEESNDGGEILTAKGVKTKTRRMQISSARCRQRCSCVAIQFSERKDLRGFSPMPIL